MVNYDEPGLAFDYERAGEALLNDNVTLKDLGPKARYTALLKRFGHCPIRRANLERLHSEVVASFDTDIEL